MEVDEIKERLDILGGDQGQFIRVMVNRYEFARELISEICLVSEKVNSAHSRNVYFFPVESDTEALARRIEKEIK